MSKGKAIKFDDRSRKLNQGGEPHQHDDQPSAPFGDISKMGDESRQELANFMDEDFPLDSDEKMDEDFVYFMRLLFDFISTSDIRQKDKALVDSWVAKLIGEKPHGTDERRNRNMYMSHLVLQVKEGTLSGPLAKQPPKGPLPYAGITFDLGEGTRKRKVEDMGDIMIGPGDFVHLSKDGRTYLATKGLPEDSGACAYLAVSIGGGDPLWLDPSGQDADADGSVDFPVTHVEQYGADSVFQTVGTEKCSVTRKKKAEREALKSFYLNILDRIDNIGPTEGNDAYDPVIAHLLDKIKRHIQAKGPMPEECTQQNLLTALKKKITNLYQFTLDREEEIEELEGEGMSDTGNELHFVNLTSNIAPSPRDDIWMTALRDNPTEETISRLKEYYPECMVDAFLFFLERQRQLIIERERLLHTEIVASMKNELLREVEEGVRNYKEAKSEWARVLSVLKNLEKTQNVTKDIVNKVPGSSDTSSPVLTYFKDAKTEKHLEDAKMKYSEARNQATEIEAQIEEINCRIADIQIKKKEANDLLQKETLRWSETISRLKRDLESQELEIQRIFHQSSREESH